MTSSRRWAGRASRRRRLRSKARTARHSEIYVADFDGHNAQAGDQRQQPRGRAVLGAGAPGAVLRLLQAQPRRHLLSRPLHRRAPRFRPVWRLEYEPGGLARRQQGGDDPEQGRLDGPVCVQSDGSEPEAADQVAAGRVLALLVAGREMDLLRGQGKRAPDAVQNAPLGRGDCRRIPTGGMPSPTEPDWSPDGKWIAFTSQYRSGFQICVVPADGGTAIALVEGEDPSWAPNSRTLAFGRRQGGHYALSLLDVPTKQYKDVSRIPGISSQSQPSWAK